VVSVQLHAIRKEASGVDSKEDEQYLAGAKINIFVPGSFYTYRNDCRNAVYLIDKDMC
jgi:hypothetical protein